MYQGCFLQTKLSMCALIKRLGRAFVSKHASEPLKHSAELLKYSAELLRISEKTKSSAECFKSSVACLCYNTAHAVPISHSSSNPIKLLPRTMEIHVSETKFFLWFMHSNIRVDYWTMRDKVFKNGPRKICGRQPLKIWRDMVCLKQTISVQIL